MDDRRIPASLMPGSGSASRVSARVRWNRRVRRLRQVLGGDLCRELGLALLPPGTKLSVIIPVYNERRWISSVVRRLRAVPLPMEIVIVDDGSTDGTPQMLAGVCGRNLRVVLKETNEGKGAAIREGLRHVTGTIVIIQDADLEYDPRDLPRLIQPIVEGRADVVYGSRFLGRDRRVHSFWSLAANRLLTVFSNLFTNLGLSDMETGYKAFRREVLEEIKLRSNGFGIEPEITAKVARRRRRWRIQEIGIRYQARSYDEGKKIRPWHAIAALACVLRYWRWD